MKVYALIMAAGESKRFNGIKQLADVKGDRLIDKAHSSYVNSQCDCVFVVLGANGEKIASKMANKHHIIRCVEWQEGLGSNIAFALTQLPNDYSHVMLAVADQIELTTKCIDTLIDKGKQYPENIVAAQYKQTTGVPVLFPKRYVSELLLLQGDVGAKALLNRHKRQVVCVNLPRAERDIDTQQDLAEWFGYINHQNC